MNKQLEKAKSTREFNELKKKITLLSAKIQETENAKKQDSSRSVSNSRERKRKRSTSLHTPKHKYESRSSSKSVISKQSKRSRSRSKKRKSRSRSAKRARRSKSRERKHRRSRSRSKDNRNERSNRRSNSSSRSKRKDDKKLIEESAIMRQINDNKLTAKYSQKQQNEILGFKKPSSETESEDEVERKGTVRPATVFPDGNGRRSTEDYIGNKIIPRSLCLWLTLTLVT